MMNVLRDLMEKADMQELMSSISTETETHSMKPA